MEAFDDAGKNSLGISEDEFMNENFKQLREVLLDGYSSILHGMTQQYISFADKECYGLQMYKYVEAMVNTTGLTFSNDLIYGLLDLYIDLVMIFCK
jgi:hypothetical protein